MVDPRDKFGAVVSTSGFGDDVLQHEGYEWGFYCTKSMDYQVCTPLLLFPSISCTFLLLLPPTRSSTKAPHRYGLQCTSNV